MLAHKKKSFEHGVQFAWDGTSLELAQTCMRKYYYAMILGITPKETSVHLIFGGIYASSLELFYKERAAGMSIKDAQESAVLHALKESWDFETGLPIAFNDGKKTREALIRTIIWYIEEFGDESETRMQTLILANGKPAVELSFALELYDDVLYCGHLDRVVDMAGHHYVLDQKTTGSPLGPYYFKQFSPNNQMSGYSWGGKIILKTPIRGVIIDAAQIGVGFSRFERQPTTRTTEQINEWLDSTIYTIQKAREATAENQFPMNSTACGNYGGCPFRMLCSTHPSLREGYINDYYKPHNWDPIKER